MMNLVRERTKQLEETREESEFYLNVWGHKIGNLLQSMILYLEMISTSSERDQKIVELADAAIEIGRETGQINRQVAALIKLKEKEDIELSPMNISEVLASSLEITKKLYGRDCVQEEYSPLHATIHVLADEFLELLFVNLLAYICKNRPRSKLLISPIATPQTIALQFSFDEPRIPLDIENSLFSEIQPSKTTLSLDLYTVKILMRKFNGVFEYSWIEHTKENQFTLTFKHVLSEEDVTKSVVEHESISDQ
jgi:light-regulated signal transduction histidine kinase (bacteriophytochrome)